MKRRVVLLLLMFGILASHIGMIATPAFSGEVPRISKEVLKALLDNPEVVVIDVRRGSDYDGSSAKVRGAVRESEKDVSWASKYPKNKVLALYCA